MALPRPTPMSRTKATPGPSQRGGGNKCVHQGAPGLHQSSRGPVPGDIVSVRGSRWRLRDVIPHADCRALMLDRLGEEPAGASRVLLVPFDRPRVIPRSAGWRLVSKRRWSHRLVRLLMTMGCSEHLETLATAGIDLLPYQVEPALAYVRGLASRILLADEVGLGKTIQAALDSRRGDCARRDTARADRHASRAARSVGRRAARAIRHRLGHRRCAVASPAESAVASFGQLLDDPSGRHHVTRLRQAAREPWCPLQRHLGLVHTRRGALGRARHRPRHRCVGTGQPRSHLPAADRHAPLGGGSRVRGSVPDGRVDAARHGGDVPADTRGRHPRAEASPLRESPSDARRAEDARRADWIRRSRVAG